MINIALLAGLLSYATLMMAQEKVEKPIEISLSAGGPQGMLGFVGGPETTFSLVTEIKYTPIKWVSVGLAGGVHDSSRSSSLGPLPEGEPEPETHYPFNMMLMLYGNWFTHNNLKLYSGIGFGTVNGYYSVKSDGHPAHGYQFTPIGISYGGSIYGFAELGMGWMFSLARAGIGIRF